MAIKGLTDTITPTLPRLGDIKKGEKTEKGFPRKLPHFVFAVVGKLPDEGETPFERIFREAYGDKPTQVMGMFIGSTEESVLSTAMRAKGKEGKTTRVCDRETATLQLVKKGDALTLERGIFDCGWQENKCSFGCKAEGRLSFVLMIPDGSEPLFVNQEGYPLGVVGHRISETDIKQVLGTLRGAMMMTPLLGMVFKLVLREWQHPQYGKIYASNFYFDSVYHRFQPPRQIEAPQRPSLPLPAHADFEDEPDGLDDFGVDAEIIEEHAVPPTTPPPPAKAADERHYERALQIYRLLPSEVDFLFADKLPKKPLAHQVDNAFKAFANQRVNFSDEQWKEHVWQPFVDYLNLDPETAIEIIDTVVPPDEMRLLAYRQALVEASQS